MKGLKKYSHKDRGKIIKEMIPLIKKKFGKNLLALAAQASYARNEDYAYSDLELIAFIKKKPRGKKWDGMGKIRDGLLVELMWTTKEMYLQHVREVTDDWYIAGSDRLVPLINKKYIEEINAYQVQNLKEKCWHQAAGLWNEIQEGVAKVLNAIIKKNRDGLPLLLIVNYWWMLKLLALLNQKPYTTFAKGTTQAKKFKTKPAHFEDLTRLIIEGKYQNLPRLRKIIQQVFTEFENIFEQQGFDLYYDNFDPNKPSKPWG